MSFDETIRSAESLTGFFFVRVAGLPYLFSHVPLPSSWSTPPTGQVLLDGDLYQWSTTLLLPDLSELSQQLAPKAGIATNGSLNFQFGMGDGGSPPPADDPWPWLLLNNPYREDGLFTVLTADLEPTETVIDVAVNEWILNTTKTLYAGLETIRTIPNTGTGTTIPVVKRGAYGSPALYHSAADRAPDYEQRAKPGFGLKIADFPLRMKGRVIELFFVPCDINVDAAGNEYLQPLGNPDSDEIGVVFAGMITRALHGSDGVTIDFSTTSIQALLDVDAVSFFPSTKPQSLRFNASNLQAERLYIGPHNNRFHVQIQLNGDVADPFFFILDNTALADGDTITIGGVVYTFRAAAALALEIQIGASRQITAANAYARMIQNTLLNLAGGWGVRRSINGIVFVYSVTGDPSAITFATSKPAAISFSGSTLERLGNIEAFNLPFGAPTDSQAPFYQVAWIPVRLEEELAPFLGFVGTTVLDGWEDQGAGRAPRYKLRFFFSNGPLVDELGGLSITILPSYGAAESMLRDMGFTDPVSSRQGDNALECIANKAPAWFRWPGPAFPTPERLFLQQFPSNLAKQDFEGGPGGTAGWVDDDGNTLPSAILLGKDEVILANEELQSIPGLFGYDYAEVIERGAFNSLADEEIYLEVAPPEKIKDYAATRLPAFANTSMERILLYLMLGGSGEQGSNDATYDQGWRGAGAAIPARLVDVDPFESYASTKVNIRDNLCVRPGDSLRALIESEALIAQQFVVIGGGRFTMIDLLPPSEIEAASATLIDLDTINSSDDAGGIGFDADENRIANRVSTKINFDNAKGSFQTEVEGSQQDSVATWGEARPVGLQVRSLADTASAATLVAAVSRNLFSAHAQPNVLLEFSFASFIGWVMRIGELVRITHDGVFSPRTPERGVTELACRVRAIAPAYTGSSPDNLESNRHARVTLATDDYQGVRTSSLAPSALINATSGGGTIAVFDDFEFGAGTRDVERFSVGWRVLIAPVVGCRKANATEHTISAITPSGSPDASTATLSPAYAGAAPAIMWLAPYNDADTVDAQRSHTYWSDGDGRLDLPSGSDAAFIYV